MEIKGADVYYRVLQLPELPAALMTENIKGSSNRFGCVSPFLV